MDLRLAYLGRSGLDLSGSSGTLSLAPNLARDPVAFDGALVNPLRFREAISALHDVVINDLRFKPRDKTAYEEWKRTEQIRRAAEFRKVYEGKKAEVLAQRGEVSPDLEKRYRRRLSEYWNARQAYANYLAKNDMELWRLLMPCDPVITVADDVVFFECFSADESSYGCLTANRDDVFRRSEQTQYGTTNVDYSWNLYNSFQQLRTYRETRFKVDPAGFEVATHGSPNYREEKINLPPGWLRGFMQLQGAMGLPMQKVSLSREAVYSLLVWLKRHKARSSPRAIRFELLPGQAPTMVLEPWEKRIVSHATKYDGPPTEPIRIWGRQRLLVLARLLPLIERFDVYLLGTGLPSFWVGQMGDMRLTLGLSGWTANDWTRGSNLDLLAAPGEASPDLIEKMAQLVRQQKSIRFEDARKLAAVEADAAAALRHLAHTGQTIYDLSAGVFRWRQIMPMALGEAELGPPNAEVLGAQKLRAQGRVKVLSQEPGPNGGRMINGEVGENSVSLLLDIDGRIKRGQCECSHHFKGGLRMGPCRHLLALRTVALEPSSTVWFERFQRWGKN